MNKTLRSVYLVVIVLTSLSPVVAKDMRFVENDFSVITDTLIIENASNVAWWMGVIGKGHIMPFTQSVSIETYGRGNSNQIQPLLLSDKGELVWSNKPFRIEYKENYLAIYGRDRLIHVQGLGSLKDAYKYASAKFFPPSGKMPDELLFTSPQYNTWIELMYDQNQKDILSYARSIIKNGFPAGVLMIDDNWQENYGKWNFNEGRFDDPKAMIKELHQMGFKVMMWVCPFVSPDCDVYRELRGKGYFLKDKDDQPAMVRWWNGVSALLDLSKPEVQQWFKSDLNRLVNDYGVDGFKFDAGDPRFYRNVELNGYTPNDHAKFYGEIGLDYPLNEYRAMWQMGGQPLAQRLNDKDHSWDHLQMLIPQMLVEGIMGYSFSCPDMIGGGQFSSFLNNVKIDQDLIVRSAQCHALMPMMQFSVAPWRILDTNHLNAVKKLVDLRQKFKNKILILARESTKTGEPIMRSMEYEFAHQGFAQVSDQFLLGSDILVAPILNKGMRSRLVKLPKGNWRAFNGKKYKGGKTVEIKANLDELIYLEKIK